MKLRAYIAGSLWTGALLLVVLAVSFSLWGLLAAQKDHDMAQVMQGVALVALVCWVLNFVTLVVLLALAQLSSAEQAGEEEERE